MLCGPFEQVPFEFFIQSPIGLVPKAGNQTRLIFHLSYDLQDSGNKSVNFYTPDELSSVKYKDLDYAVKQAIKLLQTLENVTETIIWSGKTDLKSAFCILGLKVTCFWLMVMKAKDPRTGKMHYFVDKCLPFGHTISCTLFQQFSDALAHLLRFKIKGLGVPSALTNYLDDFLFAAPRRMICQLMMKSFLDLCVELNVPVSPEKTEWLDDLIVFLGILLDEKRHLLVVPEDKRLKTITELQRMIHKRSATIKEIQGLTGLLNFLNKAITLGRAFTRRMYTKYAHTKLQQHHHIRLDSEFKEDCRVWLTFLANNGRHAVCRPFVDLDVKVHANVLDFYSDVAKGANLGVGAVFGRHWLFAQWEDDYINQFDPSIEYLELLGLYMAVFAWSSELRNQRFVAFCDNQSVVSMVNNMTSKCVNCMVLIRLLVLRSWIFNMRVFAEWTPGSKNSRADFLSRQKINKFKTITHGSRIDELPTPLPEEIWLASKIWVATNKQK